MVCVIPHEWFFTASEHSHELQEQSARDLMHKYIVKYASGSLLMHKALSLSQCVTCMVLHVQRTCIHIHVYMYMYVSCSLPSPCVPGCGERWHGDGVHTDIGRAGAAGQPRRGGERGERKRRDLEERTGAKERRSKFIHVYSICTVNPG